jgi:hypothetical protein
MTNHIRPFRIPPTTTSLFSKSGRSCDDDPRGGDSLGRYGCFFSTDNTSMPSRRSCSICCINSSARCGPRLLTASRAVKRVAIALSREAPVVWRRRPGPATVTGSELNQSVSACLGLTMVGNCGARPVAGHESYCDARNDDGDCREHFPSILLCVMSERKNSPFVPFEQPRSRLNDASHGLGNRETPLAAGDCWVWSGKWSMHSGLCPYSFTSRQSRVGSRDTRKPPPCTLESSSPAALYKLDT